MKNVLYFILKVLLILEIFIFVSWLFGYGEKLLDKKVKVDSKIYNPRLGNKIMTIHILPNTLSKGNQAMKFGQFI